MSIPDNSIKITSQRTHYNGTSSDLPEVVMPVWTLGTGQWCN